MAALRYAAYACFAASFLCIVAFFVSEEVFFIVPAVSVSIVGVLFLAFDRALSILVDIRDALIAPSSLNPALDEIPSSVSGSLEHAGGLEPNTAANISADLADLSRRLDAARGRGQA
ncbi:hypothetical protein ACLGGT_21415 [Roseovarius sp. MS2]|uniref:hypothetical protein n=1 Tax=Roseovarius sp. MS2 TaxID=3390728 RepID=UPI003EDC74FB